MLAAVEIANYISTDAAFPRGRLETNHIPNRAQGNHVNDQLAAHLKIDRYGDFWLTNAIRPSLTCQVVPRQGFRLETYRDRNAGFQVPVLVAAVSRERLFDAF